MKVTLRAARINADMTQEDAAKLMNVSVRTIANWEKGTTQPRFDQVAKLCQLYCVDIDNIFLPG